MERYDKKTGKENSMNRFVQDLTQQELFPLKSVNFENQSVIDKTIEPNLARLSLKNERKRPAPSVPLATRSANKLKKVDNIKENSKFTYLPIPKSILNNKNNYVNQNNKSNTANEKNEGTSYSSRTVPGRKMSLITGRVEFIMKMRKEYPDISAIYEVYGKIIKIVKGKFFCEQVIFLRGATGPVLQTVYYEVDTKLPVLQNGNYVCCVGRFNTNNKFQIFKLTPLMYQPPEEVLSRLQNICSFTLNKMNKNK